MADKPVQRRLAAIAVADVVGYSRLMEADEAGTLAALRQRRSAILDPVVRAHSGRIVKVMGDGVLLEFASAVSAVEAARDLQRKFGDANDDLPEDRRIVLRIGINLGEVIGEGSDIFGDGVNIAARLESLAEPGGICVSAKVHDEVRGKTTAGFVAMGEQPLKNIAKPVRVFRLQPPIVSAPKEPELALPDRPSIAVLPFQNMSGDPEQDYFSDGIAEDIITALSKLRWFFVIARNSTFGYKGKPVDVRQISRDLGVRYVLEGSVRKSGDRLRVTSQLIDAKTGGHVWAERYDRSVTDLFAVQDEITVSVVASIESQLFVAENLRTRDRPTESLDAWGCVIQAMPHVWTWAAHDTDISISLLKRALEIDPGYARANSLLAWAYAARAHLGKADPVRELETALAIARKAVELDSEDSWAHLAVGYAHMVSRRSEPAIAAFKEALAQNPNFALAHMILGSAYAYSGRSAEGAEQLALATRLSPRDHLYAAILSTSGLCNLMDGRYSEAVELERQAVHLRANFGTAWRTLAAAAGLAGDIETGAAALAEAKRLQPNLSIAWVREFHPIVREAARERYIDGLRIAGLSE
ncbi:adenylate/guanylate cyclase domain-containing protein [soil metagenome]